MWPNPQFSADFATFAEESLNGKLHFLCSKSLRERFPNLAFFLVHISPYKVRILKIQTRKSPDTGQFSHSAFKDLPQKNCLESHFCCLVIRILMWVAFSELSCSKTKKSNICKEWPIPYLLIFPRFYSVSYFIKYYFYALATCNLTKHLRNLGPLFTKP